MRWPLIPVVTVVLFAVGSASAAPRAMPEGKLPDDVRLAKPKDLNGYFPFTPPKTAEQWQPRAEALRRQILVSQGLWPLPTKTPLNAVVHGRQEFGDFSVEKVYFEAMPGYFVTGSLYRPTQKTGKHPGILRPHGHWADGRFHDKGALEVRKEIVQGAERFENGGRSPLQSMNVQLARMGCVVFHYDMIGYADSTQLSHELAHGFKKQRPEMNTVENWGLFSPQADAHLQSIMGLQTWASIRALDFLTSLEDVDTDRIGCTGASGGGTQTFILAAIDDRVKVAFPAVMVGTAMQGGCTCENASCLRVNAGNVDFAALFAPKPLGMTAANDWTKELATKGFPELQQHYAMLGAKENVAVFPFLHFGHNYNYPSRATMYSWFNKHFKLGIAEPLVEEDYPRLTSAQLTVWDAEHPKPAGGADFERSLLRWWHNDAQQQIKAIEYEPEQYAKIVGNGWKAILNRPLPEISELKFETSSEAKAGEASVKVGLLRTAQREAIPLLIVFNKEKSSGPTVVWAHDRGKTSLFTEAGELVPEVQTLLAKGATVVAPDLFMQGEFLAQPGEAIANREVEGNREFAGFTYGYNSPLFVQRAHDLLATIVFAADLNKSSNAAGTVDVIGLTPQAGPIVLAARAEAGKLVRNAAVDTHGFRFGKLLDYRDAMFVPGGAKYSDVPGLIVLAEQGRTWVAGESAEQLSSAQKFYQAANRGDNLVADAGAEDGRQTRALEWLLK